MAAGLPFSPHRNSMGEILGHSLYLLKFVFWGKKPDIYEGITR
jgi:hypothetical protein